MANRSWVLLALALLVILPESFFMPQTVSAIGGSAANIDLNTANYDAPTFVTLANYASSSQIAQAYRSKLSLAPLINNTFKIILSVGAMLAVLRIAYGGYMYMGSADMWGNKQTAKEIVSNALIGLILLFGIYLILFQINPCILNLNFLGDISPVSSPPNAYQACH